MSKMPQIKNRAPAPIQITAEQLLRVANEQGLEEMPKPPKQFITDKEELVQYQQTKRKDFEDQIRRQRHHIGIWCRYALWEAAQNEFERARSVFERALDVDYRNQTLWLKYADMEMKNKFINHARNIWDRAVTLHPRIDSFWYKYSYMEELVGAIENARQIFERWMSWEPDDLAWAAYIKFEMRQGEIDRARAIYERYVTLLPTCRAYLKYARWEEKNHEKALSRNIYERALNELHPLERTEKLLVNFARFEERCKEYERARVIYQYAMNQANEKISNEDFSKNDKDLSELKREFIAFEKRHGNKQNIESAIISQRREHYESEVLSDPLNYDAWFDYIRLEESEESDPSIVRAVYERAVANVPPVLDKKYWKRYIYLWIYYAIYEELTIKDIAKARQVYRACLNIIPHQSFTFGKIWIMAAQLEIRQKNLTAARQIFDQAIERCAKENIFKGFIELELQLGEVDRCRDIYSNYIEYAPFNTKAWRDFAQLEANVGEVERTRAIYELAVAQPDLDMPELMWKSYIDFELSESNIDNARKLYFRLLEKSGHVKVWISFAQFEAELFFSGVSKEPSMARNQFNKGYEQMKKNGLKEERLLILEAWREFEVNLCKQSVTEESESYEPSKELEEVTAKFPKKVKMRRSITAEDGVTEVGSEEYYDYIFPDDQKKMVGMKLLAKAMAWKNTSSENNSASVTGLDKPKPQAEEHSEEVAATDSNEIEL